MKGSKFPPIAVSNVYPERLDTKTWAMKRKWRSSFLDCVRVGKRNVAMARWVDIQKRDLRALSTWKEEDELSFVILSGIRMNTYLEGASEQMRTDSMLFISYVKAVRIRFCEVVSLQKVALLWWQSNNIFARYPLTVDEKEDKFVWTNDGREWSWWRGTIYGALNAGN